MTAVAEESSGPDPGRTVFPESTRLFLAQIVGNAGFFVAVLLLARLLGPSGRGTVAFVTVSCLVLARVSSVGIPEASTYLGARESVKRGSILTNLWLFTLCSTAVVAALAVLALKYSTIKPDSVHDAELAVLAAGTVIAGLVDAGIAYLYGVRAFGIAASITAVAPWFYVAFLGVGEALVGGISPRSALACWLGAHILWACALAVGAIRTVRPTGTDVRLFRRTLRYGSRAWMGSLARFANFRADQLLLGFLASEAILGTYAVAVNASEMLLYLPAAVAAVLVSSVAGSEAAVQAVEVRRAFRIVSLLTLCATAFAVLLGPLVIPSVFGPEYELSVGPFVVLSLGALGYSASAIFSGGLLGAERPGRASFGPVTSLVVGVTLDFLLIPPYGASGAAWAATVAFAAGGVVAALTFRASLGLSASDFRPKASDLRTLGGMLRKLAARGKLAATGGRTVGGLPSAEFSLRSKQYYWTRASFERVRLRLAAGRSDSSPSVRILAYHRISDDRDFLAVSPDSFRRQLELALEQGFAPIRLRQAVELISGSDELDDRFLCVTFDDGYLDNIESALPHLEALDIPATIFVPSDIMAGRSSYHWYHVSPRAITWEEARAAAEGGLLEFEVHGKTHRALPRLSAGDLHEEFVSSRAEIERELQRSVRIFCYPAGLHGQREVEMARDSGYAAAVTTQPGVNHPGDNLFRLRRTTIAWSDTLATFESKLTGALDSLSSVESWVRTRRSRARA